MKATKVISKVVDLFDERGIELVVADEVGVPLERYQVRCARPAAFAYDDEVLWLEISERRMVGLVVPCDPRPQSLLADS